MRRRHKNHAVTAMTRPRPGHDGHGHDGHGTTATGTTDADATRPRSCTVTSPAITAYKGTRQRDTTRHATRQPNKHSSEQTFDRTRVPMLRIQQTPRVGECPPRSKSRAAGSLVLTLNARWNIFGLPVTHEVFTYLVVATVVAPYILCIMFLGLMLMAVKLA